MIKHIVLESGAYLGLYTLGALYELNKKKYYKIEEIEINPLIFSKGSWWVADCLIKLV